MRDTSYAKELATAEFKDCRIERLYVKHEEQDEIRFSWWPMGRMANKPLDLPEDELLLLIEEAIDQGVFTDKFLGDLHELLTKGGYATGPKGQKRPADVIGNAVKVMQIATGEAEEEYEDAGKDKAAAELGRKGGKARAASMTPERRVEIARKAAASRWKRD